jgi:hypothetical protein
MSVAARFISIGSFPECPGAFPGGSYDYVGGLTLAQAMDFFWNIEDIQITTAGTCTIGGAFGGTAHAAGTLSFKPPTITGDYAAYTLSWEFTDSAMLFDTPLGAFGSLPANTRTPTERVCVAAPLQILTMQASGGTLVLPDYYITLISLEFRVVIDPGDATKFAIAYRFVIHAGDFNTMVVSFRNPSNSAGSVSGAFVGGTFSLRGFSFNWRAYYNTSISGASMSVAETMWTY